MVVEGASDSINCHDPNPIDAKPVGLGQLQYYLKTTCRVFGCHVAEGVSWPPVGLGQRSQYYLKTRVYGYHVAEGVSQYYLKTRVYGYHVADGVSQYYLKTRVYGYHVAEGVSQYYLKTRVYGYHVAEGVSRPPVGLALPQISSVTYCSAVVFHNLKPEIAHGYACSWTDFVLSEFRLHFELISIANIMCPQPLFAHLSCQKSVLMKQSGYLVK